MLGSHPLASRTVTISNGLKSSLTSVAVALLAPYAAGRSRRSVKVTADTGKFGVSSPTACPPDASYSRTTTSPLRSSASLTASTTMAGLEMRTSGRTPRSPVTYRSGRLVR